MYTYAAEPLLKHNISWFWIPIRRECGCIPIAAIKTQITFFHVRLLPCWLHKVRFVRLFPHSERTMRSLEIVNHIMPLCAINNRSRCLIEEEWTNPESELMFLIWKCQVIVCKEISFNNFEILILLWTIFYSGCPWESRDFIVESLPEECTIDANNPRIAELHDAGWSYGKFFIITSSTFYKKSYCLDI